MRFQSILFKNGSDQLAGRDFREPDHFTDLNLDQLVDSITKNKAQYSLKKFFYMPLHDVDSIRYRHDVMRDMYNPDLAESLRIFSASMQAVRSHLLQIEKRHDIHQKERLSLEAAHRYGEAVVTLARALSSTGLHADGLLLFKEYIHNYVTSSEFFTVYIKAKELIRQLEAIRYNILLQGLRVEVRPYQSEPDYGQEVLVTFERFKQDSEKTYSFIFDDFEDMNPVESRIMEIITQLFPDIFEEIKAFHTANKNPIDQTIAAFDREIQFYIAYHEYIDGFKMSGLRFCYPEFSQDDKEVSAAQAFDLALATKLRDEHAAPVGNDFFLHGDERLLVVSGPNQGGKTTFARMFGQMHYLASLGCPVPGTAAKLYLGDRIFTHFEREEHILHLRGKLEDDLLRMRAILDASTPRSIVIINEIFASTTLEDAVFLSKEIAAALIDLDVLGVWVTFLDEVAALGGKVVSMVGAVVPDDPAKRTFKIVRRPADGRAYALSIADKYGLTAARIRERIRA